MTMFVVEMPLPEGTVLKVTDITQELDILLGRAHNTVHNQPANRKNVLMFGTDQVIVYADNILLGESIYTIRKNTEASLVASNEILEVMLRKLDVHASTTECWTQRQCNDNTAFSTVTKF
jgi:hypothetical protein